MKIVLTFKEHHCIIITRMQLLHIHQDFSNVYHNIIENTSRFFRLYITSYRIYIKIKIFRTNIKIFRLRIKISDYTSQDNRIYIKIFLIYINIFEYTSQDFRIKQRFTHTNHSKRRIT